MYTANAQQRLDKVPGRHLNWLTLRCGETCIGGICPSVQTTSDVSGTKAAMKGLNAFHQKNPTFLLMYSALQFGPEEMAKPDGSLSLPYLAGALREAGYGVKILDVSVGDIDEPIED